MYEAEEAASWKGREVVACGVLGRRWPEALNTMLRRWPEQDVAMAG
jgi:hypothetical protein